MNLVSSDDVMDVQEEEDDGAGEEANPAVGLPSPALPTRKEIQKHDEPATKVAVWTISEGERNRRTSLVHFRSKTEGEHTIPTV